MYVLPDKACVYERLPIQLPFGYGQTPKGRLGVRPERKKGTLQLDEVTRLPLLPHPAMLSLGLLGGSWALRNKRPLFVLSASSISPASTLQDGREGEVCDLIHLEGTFFSLGTE